MKTDRAIERMARMICLETDATHCQRTSAIWYDEASKARQHVISTIKNGHTIGLAWWKADYERCMNEGKKYAEMARVIFADYQFELSLDAIEF